MKFQINKKEIIALTNIVYRAAATKNTIPALSGLLIEAHSEKGLTFTATDMEIGIIASTQEVTVIEGGRVLVNAQYFSNIIKVLPDTAIDIELDVNKNKLAVHYGRSSMNINISQEYDYPELPLQNTEELISIKQKILKEALRKTGFAAAVNHFRQIFTGVLFDYCENTLSFVASDTHRLAFYKQAVEEEVREPFNFVVPIRTVNELLRLLDNSEEKINISISKNNVIFNKENFTFVSRLLEGNYPTYEQVIPASTNTDISIKPEVLLETLERARVLPSDDKIKIPNILLDIKENEINVMAQSETIGEINDLIDKVQIEGEKYFQITFNTNYVFDIVKVLAGESEELKISLSGPSTPVIFREKDKEDYLYVLVPLMAN